MSLFRPALSRMKPYTPGEQAAPGKTIKLNTNENPYPPAPAVVEAICQAARGPLNRYPDPMATAFRRAAAEALGLPGPDWILAGNGSDEILTMLVRGFVGEGQRLRLPHPSYVLYRTLAEIQDASWEQVSFDHDWKLPTAFGKSDRDLRLVMLPNPNSPSGTVVPPSEVDAIARSLDCMLLVDEAYADFAETNCLDLVTQNERVVVSRTLSKSYGLAGIRFGFLVAQPHIIAEIAKIKDSYNCDAISIAAATAAISNQDWLADTVAKMNATRDRMHKELTALGFKVIPSQANFVWCTHPSGQHQGLYQQLKDAQILVRYMSYDGFGDGLRISVGSDEQIDALLVTLRRILS
jgi:histidinol-phosphate aminotransferase